MKEITTINGAWSEDANGWVSEELCLTGDIYLEVTLPQKGRIVIKKATPAGAVTANTTWPKALVTKWTGPDFRIRIYGSTESHYIKIITTETPTRIAYANV